MRKQRAFLILSIIVLAGFLTTSCEEAKDAVSDVQKTAALRNVDFSYKEMSFDVSLPEGALSGKSFQELYEENKELYSNPANYTISLETVYNADNSSQDAEDAKFDGMLQNIVFNNISQSPLEFKTEGFEIARDQILNITSQASINLETHRLPGLYIFEQMVSGDDITTSLESEMLYEIGGQAGSIKALSIQKDIPTKPSPEMKNFLQGLLDSGVLDPQEE